MRLGHIIPLILIILLWVLFAAWEYDVQALTPEMKKKITRYDLIMLPGVILLTLYMIWLMFKNDDE